MELGKGDESSKCFLSWLKYTVGHLIRSNKKISVFRVTSLKILCKVGTHIF